MDRLLNLLAPRSFAVLFLAIATCAIAQSPYTVNTGTGTGVGSLPYAIGLANSGSISQINVDSSVGTIFLDSQLFVNANVSINGGGTFINMNGNDRAFFLAGGTIGISDLTISNGVANGGAAGQGAGGGAGLLPRELRELVELAAESDQLRAQREHVVGEGHEAILRVG